MTNELVLVDFYGDQIVCIKDGDNNVWIAIRRLCENIGVSNQMQQRKLEKDPKFVCNGMMTHDTSGRVQKMFSLRLDQVQGWLFSNQAQPRDTISYRTTQKEINID